MVETTVEFRLMHLKLADFDKTCQMQRTGILKLSFFIIFLANFKYWTTFLTSFWRFMSFKIFRIFWLFWLSKFGSSRVEGCNWFVATSKLVNLCTCFVFNTMHIYHCYSVPLKYAPVFMIDGCRGCPTDKSALGLREQTRQNLVSVNFVFSVF